MVVDLSNAPEIVVVSSDDEPVEGFDDEDQEIDEKIDEQQTDQEADEAVGEQQVDQEVNEVELGVSDSSLNSSEELEDESDPNYDPSTCI